MGLATHRNSDWVDYVVSGEADALIADLCGRILRSGAHVPAEELPEGVYGPAHRNGGRSTVGCQNAIVQDLDSLTTPDYDDYFEALRDSPLSRNIRPVLLIETSRGCWWGQRSRRCIFCGINARRVNHRSKSPSRVLDELAALSERYGIRKFQTSDTMLPLGYFKDLIPSLAKMEDRYELFFETTASLSRSQVEQLGRAGVNWIQPGIESLHDGALRLLGKGTRGWRNVQLLKWCREQGIFVLWNYLVDIPGESLEWYDEMISWLPMIHHLQPPRGFSPLGYHRFSHLHDDPERYGLKLEPAWPYPYIYPFPADELRDLAYYFDNTLPREKEKSVALARLGGAIDEWSRAFHPGRADSVGGEAPGRCQDLVMHEREGSICITDTRACAQQRELLLEGLAAQIYRVCDSGRTSRGLVEHLRKGTHPRIEWRNVEATVEGLCDRKLLLNLQGHYLGLAVCEPHPPLPRYEDYPGGIELVPESKSES